MSEDKSQTWQGRKPGRPENGDGGGVFGLDVVRFGEKAAGGGVEVNGGEVEVDEAGFYLDRGEAKVDYVEV